VSPPVGPIGPAGPHLVDEPTMRALVRTHEWFASNSGWAPPDEETLAEWSAHGHCRAPDDCVVAPGSWCAHGLASWLLVLRTVDDWPPGDPGRRGPTA
jgi:hypothetical protein